MSLLNAKIIAYLIDMAIFLPPIEIENSFNHRPYITEGAIIKNFTNFEKRQLSLICKFFWKDSDQHYRIKEGLTGTGVQKIGQGINDYRIILFGNNEMCRLTNKFIGYLKIHCPLDIVCFDIGEVSFASNQCTNILGGDSILSPCGMSEGILGGWFKRIIDNKEKRKFVGITNNHVVSVFNQYPPKTEIKNLNGVTIGEIEKYINIEPNKPNLVDLALIRPDKNSKVVDLSLSCISNISNKIKGHSDSDYLIKNSKLNATLCNNYNGIKGSIIFSMPTLYLKHKKTKYKFEDVIGLNIGSRGDSGSLVIDEDDNVFGLFFASSSMDSQNFGFANRWKYIKQKIDFDFDYT